MRCPLFFSGEPSVARETVEGFPCSWRRGPSAQRERHQSFVGDGRLRRETVEGFPLFLAAGPERAARAPPNPCRTCG